MFQQSKTKEPDSPEHAYNYAVYLLGLSMRTEAEMRRKMTLRGYTGDVVEQTIKRLYEDKLLDDSNYAETYLRNLKEYRTLGYYGVRKKLLEKQLPAAEVEQLLAQDFTAADELASGKKLLQKELGADYKKSELTQEQKQKLARKLQARGFRSDVISRLLF